MENELELDDIAVPAMTLRELIRHQAERDSGALRRVFEQRHPPAWKLALSVRKERVVLVEDMLPELAAMRLRGEI